MVGTVDASVAQGSISGAGTGIGAGATVGAAIGAAGGPIGIVGGAVIGAAVGALAGGIGGFMSGGKKKKAKKYARMAAQIQQQREAEAYKQSFLSQIRQARIARASSLAATIAASAEEGSGSQGALSSIGSQTANTIEYLSVDRGRAVQAAAYSARARKNASTAKAIDNTTSGLLNLGAAVANVYAAYKTPDPTQQLVSNVQTYGKEVSYNMSYDPNTMLPPIKPDNL